MDRCPSWTGGVQAGQGNTLATCCGDKTGTRIQGYKGIIGDKTGTLKTKKTPSGAF